MIRALVVAFLLTSSGKGGLASLTDQQSHEEQPASSSFSGNSIYGEITSDEEAMLQRRTELKGSFHASDFSHLFTNHVPSSNSVYQADDSRSHHLHPGHDDPAARGHPHVLARAGNNITLACPGVTPETYIYLVEWKCIGCECRGCPNPMGEGWRILRYNDKLTQWDGQEGRRNLAFDSYGLRFEPVTSADSGTFLCLLNNRREPDAPIVLTVQDVPDAPPSRPLVVRLDSRSVDLSWAPPRRNHHHTVLNYMIYIKEGEEGGWDTTVETKSNDTNHTISGLHPFTVYMFKVAARNELGYSIPSRESYPTMTHRERPSGRPVFLTDKISTSSTSLSLVWQPPAKDSMNGEFMGYELTYMPAASSTSKKPTRLLINEDILRIQNYTIGNLHKHTTYVITLAVKNLQGIGPNATIELRTEDGVPLEPRSPRFFNMTSTSIGLTWQAPSNAPNLGHELLGYRIYITEKCNNHPNSLYRGTGAGRGGSVNDSLQRRCRKIKPMTISGTNAGSTTVTGLSPFTKYRIVLRAFTKKREGPASDALVITTDTDPPHAPLITNITCHGADELQVEWRRPEGLSGRSSPIRFYKIQMQSRRDSGPIRTEHIHVEIMNDTLRNVAFLNNLTSDSVYDVSVTAFVESVVNPGRFYRGPPSIARRVFVGERCDPHQAFSKVPQSSDSDFDSGNFFSFSSTNLGYNAGIVAGVVCTATGLILIALVTLVCRRHKPRYEFLALTPKYRGANSAAGNGNASGAGAAAAGVNGAANGSGAAGPGWMGDPESDIPVSLLAKHVTGLHAAHDMAFHKDFEAIHTASPRLSHVNGFSNGHALNGSAGGAQTTFPDILNGRDCVSHTGPIFVDGWMHGHGFVCLLGESPFSLEATWRTVWDQGVTIVVSLLSSADKDDLSTLSDTKSFGEYSVTLQNEDILPNYTIRTMRIRHRKQGSERFLTQLTFARWPAVGLPEGGDLLAFVKATFSCRESVGGRVLIHTRLGIDPCLMYASLETMLAQLRDRGDINLPHYARHLSARHDLALSSPHLYIFLHDILAEASDYGQLHSVLQNGVDTALLGMPQ